MGKKLVVHLGSNCGERKANLNEAINGLSSLFGKPIKSSSFYETAAWGKTDQDDFINAALLFDIERNWDALEVLTSIVEIETAMKRERFEKWGPRIIDIDILYLDNEVVKNRILEIPHPLLHERRFVLEPLNEILPDFEHPLLKKTTSIMLDELSDELRVERL